MINKQLESDIDDSVSNEDVIEFESLDSEFEMVLTDHLDELYVVEDN